MKYSFIFILLIILLSISNCARVGRPTGGEKDIVPPIIISATPDFKSTNYKGEKIKISFNEYIRFKDLNQQLVISPPLNHPPEITPLGFPSKFITIKITDTLKENTTYTFSFGNAIIDNSEGNSLKQFKYLFSTGDIIDSLEVSGIVKDAFLQESTSNISILLYAKDSSYNDSIVYKRKPSYVGNTLDSINFSITNIKSGKYQLIALNDINKNLLFDPKEDKIGFLDEAIDVLTGTVYELKLFKEKREFAIKNISELSKNHLIIGYEGSIDAAVEDLRDKYRKPIDFLSYKDRLKDSLHIWYRNIDTDSLLISIKHKDTVIDYSQRLRIKEVDSLQLSKNIKKTLHLKDSLYILSNTPIFKIETSKIKLLDKDSLEIPFRISKDKLGDRFLVDFIKRANTSYVLTILPSGVVDFLGQENDSLRVSFNTKSTEDYGEINISIKIDIETPIIIELLTESGTLIVQDFLKNSKELKYSLLQPGKYQLRAIYDQNDNKKWDTGSFIKKIQPEKVFYYNKVIDVRANWSISENFIIN